MNDYQVLQTGAARAYTVNFAPVVPPAVAITSVVFTISPQSGSPMTPSLSGQVDDDVNLRSTIIVSGVAHGVIYTLLASAVLNNGETATQKITLVGWSNG